MLSNPPCTPVCTVNAHGRMRVLCFVLHVFVLFVCRTFLKTSCCISRDFSETSWNWNAVTLTSDLRRTNLIENLLFWTFFSFFMLTLFTRLSALRHLWLRGTIQIKIKLNWTWTSAKFLESCFISPLSKYPCYYFFPKAAVPSPPLQPFFKLSLSSSSFWPPRPPETVAQLFFWSLSRREGAVGTAGMTSPRWNLSDCTSDRRGKCGIYIYIWQFLQD